MLDSNTIIIVASILGAALIGVGASFAATRGDSSVATKASNAWPASLNRPAASRLTC